MERTTIRVDKLQNRPHRRQHHQPRRHAELLLSDLEQMFFADYGEPGRCSLHEASAALFGNGSGILSAHDPSPGPTLVGLPLIRADHVKPESIKWAWRYRIAFGKLNGIVGDGDLGKTTVLIDLAARFTRGDQMPDGSLGVDLGIAYRAGGTTQAEDQD